MSAIPQEFLQKTAELSAEVSRPFTISTKLIWLLAIGFGTRNPKWKKWISTVDTIGTYDDLELDNFGDTDKPN